MVVGVGIFVLEFVVTLEFWPVREWTLEEGVEVPEFESTLSRRVLMGILEAEACRACGLEAAGSRPDSRH